MRIFKEVLSDYVDPETHETAIDGYLKNDPDADGVIVAWVKPDGAWRIGEHSRPEYLLCELVQEHIQEVSHRNLKERLQEPFVLPYPKSGKEYDVHVSVVWRRLAHNLHALIHLDELGSLNKWSNGFSTREKAISQAALVRLQRQVNQHLFQTETTPPTNC